MAGDGGGTPLPGEAEGEGQVPIVNGGVVRGVAGGTPPDPAWDETVASVFSHPTRPIPHTLQGLISVVIWVDGIPSGGLQGAGVDVHQPLESFCSQSHEGHDSDSGGR